MLDYSIQGQGEPIVLIHGLFGSKSNLGAIARHLSASFQVISVDVRNHGDSFHSSTMDYPTMAEDIIALLDELNIADSIFLGHSMGGKIAMQLALNYTYRVSKLIVVDIAPVAYKRGHDTILDGLIDVSQQTISSRKQADDLLKRYVESASIRSFLLKNLKPIKGVGYTLKLNLSAIHECYQKLIDAVDGKPFLNSCLFIKGAGSDYLIEAYKGEILRLFPQAQLKEIANAGHWPHSEKTVIFNTVVERFLLGSSKFVTFG